LGQSGACQNLLAEASLYRWGKEDGDAETPLDDHNHALAALRYLISRLDEGKQGRVRQAAPPPEQEPPKQRPWLSLRNEWLWRGVW
jgi:hypothetical protein